MKASSRPRRYLLEFPERTAPADTSLARIGILYYRAHQVSGNTAFAHPLADAIDATGEAVGVPIFAFPRR